MRSINYHSVSRWSDFQLKLLSTPYLPSVLSTRDYVFSGKLPPQLGQPQKVITYIRLTNLFNAMFLDRVRQESFLESRRFAREVRLMLKHWAVFQFEVTFRQAVYNRAVFRELKRNWEETCLHLPDPSDSWVAKSLYEAEEFEVEGVAQLIGRVHGEVLRSPREWDLSRLIKY